MKTPIADPIIANRTPSPAFSMRELRRVGAAATIIAVCGTLIIIVMTTLLGHYNSLAHATPKAILDGAVIALLIGPTSRWRSLALLGVVYGLLLLLQIGVIYLPLVMAIAGMLAALTGYFTSLLHRSTAIFLAAALYELLAGFGMPIKIYFATAHHNEPFLWALWFAEWPLRILGSSLGVYLARYLQRDSFISSPVLPSPAPATQRPTAVSHATKSTRLAALHLLLSILACVVPFYLESPRILAIVALLYILYALRVGIRWPILHALLGLFWDWLVFSSLSFLWHHDTARILDMFRTFVLRFTPMAITSLILVTATRPLDLLRVFRHLRFPTSVLLPLAATLRNLPRSRRDTAAILSHLRHEGLWTGPLSLLRHPLLITRRLFAPQLKRWLRDLSP